MKNNKHFNCNVVMVLYRILGTGEYHESIPYFKKIGTLWHMTKVGGSAQILNNIRS